MLVGKFVFVIFHTLATPLHRADITLWVPGFLPPFLELCNPITRQAIELESYPNHPRIQQVL